MNNPSTNFERIYHFHIRKCGGTSFNVAFSSYPDGNKNNYKLIAESFENKYVINNMPIVGWNYAHLKRGDYWYGFSHTEFDRIFPLKKNTFSFTFLRDPSERLLSHYNMLLNQKKQGSQHPSFKQEGNWLGETFTDFLQNIPREHLQNQLFMFSSMFNIKQALDNLKLIDFIGITGRDEEILLNFLKVNFQIDINYKHMRKSQEKYSPSKNESDHMLHVLKEEYLFFHEATNIINSKIHKYLNQLNNQYE